MSATGPSGEHPDTGRRHRRRVVAGAATAAAVATAAVLAAGGGSASAGTTVARATLRASAGNAVGTVEVVRFDYKAEVRVRLQVPAQLAGFHGFHVHAMGQCDPRSIDPETGSAFFSAGGHLADAGTNHSEHVGDMPPLYVTNAGEARATFDTERLVLDKLFDADGSAVIVHYGSDNLGHIPSRYSAAGVPGADAATRRTGDAGGRLACGVLQR